ncbi:hypothetical protein CBS9595_001895 [Malassezia furfur]|nr:hypothetical protein CBS9595_001895 [Malassezia furfur]
MLQPRSPCSDVGGARLTLCQAVAHLSRQGACPDGVYVSPDNQDTLRWNGVVFVRSGAYASGVFRFSIQFTTVGSILAIPSVFLPQILLHPLVEPGDGRLNLQPFLALAHEHGWETAPDQPEFFAALTQYIAACFDDTLLERLSASWIRNERMYTLFTTEKTLFGRLAQQSASLSNADAGLYDAHSGSNVPGDMDFTLLPHHKQAQKQPPSSALPFAPLSDIEFARIRDHIQP